MTEEVKGQGALQTNSKTDKTTDRDKPGSDSSKKVAFETLPHAAQDDNQNTEIGSVSHDKKAPFGRCSACGAPLARYAHFCSQCGAKVPLNSVTTSVDDGSGSGANAGTSGVGDGSGSSGVDADATTRDNTGTDVTAAAGTGTDTDTDTDADADADADTDVTAAAGSGTDTDTDTDIDTGTDTDTDTSKPSDDTGESTSRDASDASENSENTDDAEGTKDSCDNKTAVSSPDDDGLAIDDALPGENAPSEGHALNPKSKDMELPDVAASVPDYSLVTEETTELPQEQIQVVARATEETTRIPVVVPQEPFRRGGTAPMPVVKSNQVAHSGVSSKREVVIPTERPAKSYSTKNQSSQTTISKKGLVAIIVVVAILAAGIGVFFGMNSTPGRVDPATTDEALQQDANQTAGDQAGDGDTSQDQNAAGNTDDQDYILPDSDKRVYSNDELSQLSDNDLYLARNEIYARHGRIFTNQDLADYFGSKPWYKPEISSDKFDDSVLNNSETANIKELSKMEKQRGINDSNN